MGDNSELRDSQAETPDGHTIDNGMVPQESTQEDSSRSSRCDELPENSSNPLENRENFCLTETLPPSFETSKKDEILVPREDYRATCAGTSQGAILLVDSLAEAENAKHDKVVGKVYHLKRILFMGNLKMIVMQNENGPCPLIAMYNCLNLSGRIQSPVTTKTINFSQLTSILVDYMIFLRPNKDSSASSWTIDHHLSFDRNFEDALCLMPKLQTGLDVNPRFADVTSFEYTQDCILFDLVGLTLVHGWLPDPQDKRVFGVVSKYSYNQLVELSLKESYTTGDENTEMECIVAAEYISDTAGQLTVYGLCELISKLDVDRPYVFFRNNHFSTLIKHQEKLYVLATDQGFEHTPVIWEGIDSTDGDDLFYNDKFVLISHNRSQMLAPLDNDRDYAIAVQLQLEEENRLDEHRRKEKMRNSLNTPGGSRPSYPQSTSFVSSPQGTPPAQPGNPNESSIRASVPIQPYTSRKPKKKHHCLIL